MFEYYMFTEQDPIACLKDLGKKLPLHKKVSYARHIRRAEALLKKCAKFRDVVVKENNLVSDIVGTAFSLYFDEKVDKKGFVVIANDPAKDFCAYINQVIIGGLRLDDKYISKATNMILKYSDQINAFIRAFMAMRDAQREYLKLAA